MKKILLANYSLSVFFSGEKTDLIKNGTWFIFANQLFFIAITISVFILTRFNTKLHTGILVIFYLAIWYCCFYGTRKLIFSLIESKEIATDYKVSKAKKLLAFSGLSLFIGSFILLLIVGILNFQGYFLQ